MSAVKSVSLYVLFWPTFKASGNAAWNSKNAQIISKFSVYKSLGENEFSQLSENLLKRAYFAGNTISQDCVGVTDHILIDSSLNLCFVNCLSSPQQPRSKAGNSPIVAQLLIYNFSKNYKYFLGENVTM